MYLALFLIVSVCVLSRVIAQNEVDSHNVVRTPRDMKRSAFKFDKLKKLVHVIEDIKPPPNFMPDSWCKPHSPNGPAVFAAAMSKDMLRSDVRAFAGSLRKTGYKGDIVLAVYPDSNPKFLSEVREVGAIVYSLSPDCTGEGHDMVCSFPGMSAKFSINMIRFYLYIWWAKKYDDSALIMVSDFRDVFFQSNPFEYRQFEWAPPSYQMTVFLEPYPNKMIYRCPFNSGWIENCYGTQGLRRVGSNQVSCSGVSIATRDAIMAYAYLMTQQLDPRVRSGKSLSLNGTSSTSFDPAANKRCVSLGMDQGFHNWLLYSGQLDKLLDIKFFPQGEGPVNTVGAFFGERAKVKLSLEQWGVLKGQGKDKYIYNWNGDKSPVVHQADRFLGTEFKGNYAEHLAVLNDIYS